MRGLGHCSRGEVAANWFRRRGYPVPRADHDPSEKAQEEEEMDAFVVVAAAVWWRNRKRKLEM